MALLFGSAAGYDAQADREMIRRLGALTWLLSAALATAMLFAWPPRHPSTALGLSLAAAGIGSLALAGLITLRRPHVSLIGSLAVSIWTALVFGGLQWMAGGGARFTTLIGLPLMFVGGSHPPRRVGLALAFGALAQIPALLASPLTATAVASAALNVIIWTCTCVVIMIWTAGVRWQRMALGHERRQAEHLALHDPVTGLGNRRKLMVDLEAAAREGRETAIALFDLNGFKAYNDAYGHPAGDALLRRLGVSLAQRTQGIAEAYRMGGDEFCLLGPGDMARGTDLVQLGCRALSERGEDFLVSATGGAAAMPSEADEPVDALRLADTRMYASKHRRRASLRPDAYDTLRAALLEPRPQRFTDAESVARFLHERIGLTAPEEPQAA